MIPFDRKAIDEIGGFRQIATEITNGRGWNGSKKSWKIAATRKWGSTGVWEVVAVGEIERVPNSTKLGGELPKPL